MAVSRRLSDRNRRLVLRRPVSVMFLIAALAGGVAAAEFPERPIHIVVPFAPGGESDTFTRIVQRVIQQEGLCSQPIVVINVPGAGGTIGSRRVRDADPDGYTLLNLHDGILSAWLTGQVDYGPDAFTPIAALGRASSVVCVGPNSSYENLQDLMQAARDRPGTIRFGANLGALSHFGALQLEQAVDGAAFRYVPTGGGARRFGDLVGGHIDVSVFNAGEFAQFRDSGLRALAILHTERHPAFPDVPTAREQGIDVVRNSLQYFWAPRQTPADRVQYLVRLFRRVYESAEFQQRLDERKIDPIFLTGLPLRQELKRRELVMRSVKLDGELRLPNTPLFAGLAVVVFSALFCAQRIRSHRVQRRSDIAEVRLSDDAGPDSVPREQGVSPTGATSEFDLRRAVVTFAALLVYCLLFSTGRVPFWLLSAVFVTGLGLFLLPRSRKNVIVLVIVGVLAGPGLHLLFTEWLTIDLP